MTSRRNRKSRVLVTRAIDLGFAVPEVVARRVMRMALAGSSPSVRDRKELHLMGAEKMAAFYESWSTMWVEIFRANLELSLWSARFFWLRWPATSRSSRAAGSRFQQAALGALAKGVAPVHRRAVANVKRLRRG
jgi:hypothetical protein